jgi:glycosyltransferase involved in cell wall biosynthesis
MDTYLEKMERLVEKVEDWSALPSTPAVSVWMITYNHEAFIRQALDGILMQVTSFPYEVVIGEDMSTDQTREIVQEYQRHHPDRIRLRLAKENLYSQGMKPFASVLNACRGKYIALCEGDDYWTDPLKLQKQMDFLEAHPSHAVCFHRAYQLVQATGEMKIWQQSRRLDRFTYTLDDLARDNFVATPSIMFRNGLVVQMPSWFFDAPCGDWPLLVLLAQHGTVGFIDQAMAVHRIHGGGMFGGASESVQHEMSTKMFDLLRVHLSSKYEDQIQAGVSDYLLNWAWESADQGDLSNAKDYFFQSIVECPLNRDMRIFDRLVLLARLYAPPVYKAVKRLQESLHLSGRRGTVSEAT